MLGGKFYGIDEPDLREKCKNADVLIFVHNNGRHLRRLKGLAPKAKKVWWMNDLRPPEGIELPWLDHIFLCNKEFIDKYKNDYKVKNASYLPQGAPIKQIEKIHLAEPIKWDIVFIGGLGSHKYHGHRKSLIQSLSEEFTIEHRNAVLRNDRIRIEQQSYYLYKYSPFSLSTSVPSDGYTSNRLYNILSCSGFAITNHFPGIEDLFEPGKHLIVYYGAEDLKKKIRYYLDHPNEHYKIKMAGYEHFLNNHTCIHRIFTILDTIL